MTDLSSNLQVEETSPDDNSGMSATRIIKLVAFGLIAFVILCLIFALIVSITASDTWAPVIQIFRDIFIVFMIVEIILIIGATAILILQISRFVVMLQTEIKPILDNARETTKATRTSAEFVRKNAVDPIIQFKAFFAGLTAFIRELLRIRSILNPKPSKDDGDHE